MDNWKQYLSIMLLAIVAMLFPSVLVAGSPQYPSSSRIEIKGDARRYLKEIEIQNSDGSPWDSDTTSEIVGNTIRITWPLEIPYLKG